LPEPQRNLRWRAHELESAKTELASGPSKVIIRNIRIGAICPEGAGSQKRKFRLNRGDSSCADFALQSGSRC
jgi:hypothetical protein